MLNHPKDANIWFLIKLHFLNENQLFVKMNAVKNYEISEVFMCMCWWIVVSFVNPVIFSSKHTAQIQVSQTFFLIWKSWKKNPLHTFCIKHYIICFLLHLARRFFLFIFFTFFFTKKNVVSHRSNRLKYALNVDPFNLSDLM